MRVKSDGTNITGEYSTDGTTWTTVGQSAALPANAKIGLFALSNAAATNATAKFDYVTVEGPGAGAAPARVTTFNGTSLDKTTLERDRPRGRDASTTSRNGGLTATTVEGDIYTNSDASGTRNLFLQTADHAGADYVLETKVTGTLAGGYSQGGIIVYTRRRQLRQARRDLRRQPDADQPHRAALGGRRGGPEPAAADHGVPTGDDDDLAAPDQGREHLLGRVLLRRDDLDLGRRVRHEHAQTAPQLRPATRSAAGGRRGQDRDLRLLQGQRLARAAAGRRTPRPVITSATATPSAGIAPLQVAFSAAATDADGDTLTYSWDFDGNGTADATGATASTTFTTAGTKTVKLTVSDGKGGTATKDIPVQVLAADDTSKRFRALVFSKTAAFRHDSIPRASRRSSRSATRTNFQVDATEDATLFRDDVLWHYDVGDLDVDHR